MPNKKILYIHAGMNKTGSTSIQKMFYNHHKYFLKQGVYYPFTGKLQCHHDIVLNHFEDVFWKKTDNFMSLLKKDILAKKPDKCLLSSEILYFLLDKKEVAEEIKAVFSDYQIRIIVYIRRADKWLPSAYRQQIMRFRYRELNKDFRYVDHIEKLNGIKMVWGLSNEDIIIRPFEKGQFYQNDLLKDLLNIIQVDDPKMVSDSIESANVKSNLNLDIIEYVRQMSVHVNHVDPSEISVWQKLFAEYPVPKEYEDVSLFGSYANLEETMNLYAPMYEHMAREYLGRPDGKMFFEDPPPDKEHFKPYPVLTVQKMAQINGYLYDKIKNESPFNHWAPKRGVMKRLARMVKDSDA
jgi:hypothetical protein